MKKTAPARAKAKTAAASQPQPLPALTPRPARALRSTIAAVVSDGRERAAVYARNPKMLRGLVEEASGKLATLDRRVFKESWTYLLSMLRLLKACASRRYKGLTHDEQLTIIATVAYFVSPLDLIPDFVEGVGYVDDAMVVRAVHRQVQDALDRFMEWESGVMR